MHEKTIFHLLGELMVERCGNLITQTVTDACAAQKGEVDRITTLAEKAFGSLQKPVVLTPERREFLRQHTPQLAAAYKAAFKQRLADDSFEKRLPTVYSSGASSVLTMQLTEVTAMQAVISTGRLISLAELVCEQELRFLIAQQIAYGIRRNVNPYRAETFVKALESAFEDTFSGRHEWKALMMSCGISFVRQLQIFLRFHNTVLERLLAEPGPEDSPPTLAQAASLAAFADTEPMPPASKI